MFGIFPRAGVVLFLRDNETHKFQVDKNNAFTDKFEYKFDNQFKNQINTHLIFLYLPPQGEYN